jgi:hypothetical protein
MLRLWLKIMMVVTSLNSSRSGKLVQETTEERRDGEKGRERGCDVSADHGPPPVSVSFSSMVQLPVPVQRSVPSVLSPFSFRVHMNRLKEENNSTRNDIHRFRNTLQVLQGFTFLFFELRDGSSLSYALFFVVISQLLTFATVRTSGFF